MDRQTAGVQSGFFMSASINFLLRLLKWPVALGALVVLPGAVLAFKDEVEAIVDAFQTMRPFLYGAGGYAVVWMILLRPRSMREGTFWSTLEHEATHIIFALLTFNRVRELNATSGQGGHMRFVGGGNWLVGIAPYFFPTLSVPVILVMLLLEGGGVDIANAVLGVTVAYHITSTYKETHRRQTDLHQVGMGFAWCFLPSANVVSFGLIAGTARNKLDGLRGYANSVWDHSQDLWLELEELLRSLT